MREKCLLKGSLQNHFALFINLIYCLPSCYHFHVVMAGMHVVGITDSLEIFRGK